MKKLFIISFTVWAVSALSCFAASPKSGLDPERFKTDSTALYTISNQSGMEACITNYGARIVSLSVPDKDGLFKDVVLGFDNINDYVSRSSAFGALIGRFANRIAAGKFSLDGKEYQLPLNERASCLHGGPVGWQYRVFEYVSSTASSLKLRLISVDGDQQFPGNLTLYVEYSITPENRFEIKYSAVCDAPSVINVTNHSYFNLSGDPGSISCDNDLLWIDADCYTVSGAGLVPTGELASVEGTGLDFRKEKTVASGLGKDIRGYDHNLVLNTAGDKTRKAAVLYNPVSGIEMAVFTDEPGMQLYCNNGENGKGKGGVRYIRRSSVCLETQHYPDTPNHPEWPSTTIRPGELFSSYTAYEFSVRK